MLPSKQFTRLATCQANSQNTGSYGVVYVAGDPTLMQPSDWWWAMRTEPEGEELLKDILRQTLLALQALHAANITHRFETFTTCPRKCRAWMDMQ